MVDKYDIPWKYEVERIYISVEGKFACITRKSWYKVVDIDSKVYHIRKWIRYDLSIAKRVDFTFTHNTHN